MIPTGKSNLYYLTMKHAFDFDTFTVNIASAATWITDITNGFEGRDVLDSDFVAQRLRMFDHCLVAAFQVEEN